MKKILLFIIMLISVQQSFALFPTDEMLKDPLFDSLFVIHNDKERRVDDSLYRVYEDEHYRNISENDPRYPYWMRKILIVDKTIYNIYKKSYLNIDRPVFKNIPQSDIKNGKLFNYKFIYIKSDFKNGKSLNELINDELKNCKNKKRQYNRSLHGHLRYYYIKDIGDSLYVFKVSPIVGLKKYLAAKILIEKLNYYLNDNYKAYVVSYEIGNGFMFGISYKGINIYNISSGYILFDNNYNITETKYNLDEIQIAKWYHKKERKFNMLPYDVIRKKVLNDPQCLNSLSLSNYQIIDEGKPIDTYLAGKSLNYSPNLDKGLKYSVYSVATRNKKNGHIQYWKFGVSYCEKTKDHYNLEFSKQTNILNYPRMYYFFKFKQNGEK